ncbi:MAG: chaperone modulator CbpM [Pararhizobium sp.]
MDDREFCSILSIETRICEEWVAREWLRPVREGERRHFSAIDVARGRFLIDLDRVMGVNPDGIDVIVHLVDQLYGMRRTMGDLAAALAAQPDEVRERILSEARRTHAGGSRKG